jgi:hypothetical protein
MDQILHGFAPCAQFAEDDEKRIGTEPILKNVIGKVCGLRSTRRVFAISPLRRRGKWRRKDSNSLAARVDALVPR